MRGIYVDPGLVSYALQLATATRRPAEFGLPDLARFISFGASPRGPISLIHAARGLAVVRGRDYVLVQDLQELIKDALRHRLVLSYEALAERRSADSLLDEIVAAVPVPQLDLAGSRRVIEGLLRQGQTPARPGPGPMPEPLLRALDLTIARRVEGLLPGDHRSTMLGRGSELAQIRPYEPVEDDVRQIDWNVTARTGTPHVRIHLAERALVTWLVLDTSPSMTFGTAERRKADVAEGASLAVGYAATRRGNRLGLVTFGDETPRTLPARQGRAGLLGLLLALRKEEAARDRNREGAATSIGEGLLRAGTLARQRARTSSSSPTSAGRATGAGRCSC